METAPLHKLLQTPNRHHLCLERRSQQHQQQADSRLAAAPTHKPQQQLQPLTHLAPLDSSRDSNSSSNNSQQQAEDCLAAQLRTNLRLVHRPEVYLGLRKISSSSNQQLVEGCLARLVPSLQLHRLQDCLARTSNSNSNHSSSRVVPCSVTSQAQGCLELNLKPLRPSREGSSVNRNLNRSSNRAVVCLASRSPSLSSSNHSWAGRSNRYYRATRRPRAPSSLTCLRMRKR